jgi:hypothetical protein
MTAPVVASNLGGIALFALPGLGLAALFPALARLSWWRRIGYAYALGVVAVAATLFAASHLFAVPLRRPLIAAAVAVPILAGLAAHWRRRRLAQRRSSLAPPAAPGHTKQPLPPPVFHHPATSHWQTAATTAAALAVGAIFLGTLASALSLPLGDWDGRLAWGAQAAYMRHEGTVDAAVLRQAPWFIVHPRYPPLLPLAQVAVQETFAAGVGDELFRGLYAAFMAALLLILYDGARRAAGAAAATIATLCAALPRCLSFGMGSATSAYSDLPLACFYGAALILLLLRPPRRSTGLAAGCLLAGMVLTKNEGTFLAVFTLGLAALRLLRWRRRRLATHRLPWLGAAALPPLAAAALLAAWRTAIPNRFTTDFFTGLRPVDFVHGAANRLPEILRGVVGETFHADNWYGLWALFLLVLLTGRRALRRPAVRRLLAAGLAPLAIGLAAYCVNPTLGELIAETWSRFLLQGLIPLALVLAAALHDVLRQVLPAQPPAATAGAATSAAAAGATIAAGSSRR